ncbi:RimK family alpha-L-glutamate ligase [Agromyces sp. NPDC058136]|uniref:ATP-grasp domain-containing protein n=1 Tax=Agromyces sp. NPDC058136 TaxID=3346354 RepID=UPI0036D83A72
MTWPIPDVEALFADDRRLLEALREQRVDAEAVAWNDPAVDWSRFDAAVLRSTWDYVDHLEAFLATTAAIARSGCLLLNPPDAVRWNADKHYLDDLDRLGVPIVPVVRGGRGDAEPVLAAVRAAGWDELVLKPAIGVGGSGVTRTSTAGLARAIEALPEGSEVMVQPFAQSIASEGEFSFVFLGGAPSHVLRKRPAPGDFRAHGIYGGTIGRVDPRPADAAEVEAMRRLLPFDLLYARFDVVRFEGRLRILELELIEPMLYLDLAPGSARRLADATITRIAGR